MTFLAALHGPELLNIPVFALGHPKARESWALHMAKPRLNRPEHAWLQANMLAAEGLHTRNFLPPKTAAYVEWLRFPDADARNAFLTAFPQHDPARKGENLRAAHRKLEEQIAARIAKGNFDLSRHGEEHRLNLARRYIELRQALRTAADEISAQGILIKFQAEWENSEAVAQHLRTAS